MKSQKEMVLRILLGIALVLFGINKFYNFMGMPSPPDGSFMSQLSNSGYLMQLVGISEIVIGLLLLTNKWKGFALVWLAPISINIVAFHLVHALDASIVPSLIIAFLNTLLIMMNWKRFKGLFN